MEYAVRIGRAALEKSVAWTVLLSSGILGSLGLVGLINRTFGWDGLELIDIGLYNSVVRLTEWWNIVAVDFVSLVTNYIGLQAETNSISATAALLLISAVGIRHFQFKLADAVNKPVKKKPGRRRKDQYQQAKGVFWYWVKQKFANTIQSLRNDSWIAVAMVAAYLVVVLAVNLSKSPISPDTIKGMAYMVLGYAGFHAMKELLKSGAYVRYLWVMAASTVGLTAASYWIEYSSASLG